MIAELRAFLGDLCAALLGVFLEWLVTATAPGQGELLSLAVILEWLFPRPGGARTS